MPLNREVTKPSSESEQNFVFKNDDDEMGLFDEDNNCVLKLTIPVDAITAVAAILLSSLFFILGLGKVFLSYNFLIYLLFGFIFSFSSRNYFLSFYLLFIFIPFISATVSPCHT